MKTYAYWSFDRYRPCIHGNDSIYVTRIVPSENGFEIWHDFDGKCGLYYREAESENEYLRVSADNGYVCLLDLNNDTEYEFYISDGSENTSAIGYVHTGYAPGTVVNYLSKNDKKYDFSGKYLCTPSILCHPDGYMLVSMDIYEAKGGQNLTLIFRSDDGGKSWYHLCELFPCYWGTLFLHKGEVYMLGTSTEYGDMLIGKSIDGGKTWLVPTVIHRGSCNCAIPGWHKSSCRVVEHGGRIWCAYDYGSHATGRHASCVISADVDADILCPHSWSITEPLTYNENWFGACSEDRRGCIEGCVVAGKDNKLYNVLRYSMSKGTPNYGKIARLAIYTDEPERSLEFDKFIPFAGNHSKFDIVYDNVSEKYWSIISRIRDEQCVNHRNLLSLVCSDDMERWELVTDLIDYTDKDPKYHGFQYVSMTIYENDIRYVCRTATNCANNFHDSNYITYHTVDNFRKYIMGE